jgi:streptomycin 6-kinase
LTPDAWPSRWDLVPDGEPIETPSSLLLAVRRHGEPAMLKIAREEEERRGGRLMVWWNGDGAARVLAHDDPAILLERLGSERSLATMAAAGEDDEASRILCAALARLHEPRRGPPPALAPLSQWFEALTAAARTQGGFLAEADAMAGRLLADQREVVVLHGDIHHFNVLDAGPRGWLAIDPKGLLGERTFDFVNILRNPDLATATAPGRFAHQVGVLAKAGVLDPRRLIKWTVAFTGLSAAWHLSDGTSAELDLAVGGIASAALKS